MTHAVPRRDVRERRDPQTGIMQTNTRPAQFTAAIAAAAALTAALTGCSTVTDIGKSMQDAWSVTYEISVDGADTVTLSDVSYLGAESRVDGAKTVKVGDAEAQSGSGGSASWSVETLVVAGKQATVTATPPSDLTASCKILLDGTKEIAAETGTPGAPVTCDVVTPEFE